MRKLHFCLFIYFLLLAQQISSLGCLNQQGSQIDWWIIFKMPYIVDVNPEGMIYFYCDSSDDCEGLIQQNDLLNTTSTSPLFQTLKQFNKFDADQISITWSDQPYNKSTISDYAHSKGILAVDASIEQGFVINHSLPEFPVVDSEGNLLFQFDDNASDNGQQFFCFTATSATIESMAQSYSWAQTRTSYFHLDPSMQTIFPNLNNMKNNYQLSSNTGQSTLQPLQQQQIQSIGGLQIQMFAISSYQLFDFYDFVVAPSLQVPLFVETWGNGSGGLESPTCVSYDVQSNLYVFLTSTLQYSYTKDHSKYAISQLQNLPYVCMSDMNRQTTQEKRGGTTLCFNQPSVWNIIKDMFTQQQQCP